jgi:hypothetical protein
MKRLKAGRKHRKSHGKHPDKARGRQTSTADPEGKAPSQTRSTERQPQKLGGRTAVTAQATSGETGEKEGQAASHQHWFPEGRGRVWCPKAAEAVQSDSAW